MNAQNWKSLGNFVSVNNNKIFVIDSGKSRETIVILHGYPTLTYDYHTVIPELAKDYRVIIHDHPGFGFSDSPDSFEYSLIEQADVALKLWSNLGLKEVTILAHDHGNYVAKEILARKNNDLISIKIKKMILCCSSKGLERLEISKINSLLNDKKIGEYIYSITNKGFQKVKSILSNEKYDIDALHDRYHNDSEAKQVQITSNFIKDRYTYWHRWTDALKESEVPVKIFWQKSDSASVEEIALVLASDRVNKNIEWIENKGYFSIEETPRRWLHMVFDINNQKSRVAAFL
jgi:pimeloyl-ACP methyl ester carboxylesterase